MKTESIDLRNVEYKDWPAFLTPTEVSELFRVDPKTVTRWAAVGKIDSIKTLGGHRRFSKETVHDAWKKQIES